MRNTILGLMVLTLVFAGCGRKAGETRAADNPFFAEFDTPFGVPPFGAIRTEHYRPAFEKGMADQKKEVEDITASSEPPTFVNTIEALERSGALLAKVAGVFFNLTSSHTSEELQAIEKDIAPLLAQHADDIAMNPALFARVKAVTEGRDALELTPEQAKLLDETYKGFVRGGAGLDAEKQARLRQINEELSLLSVQFGENLLKENNAFELVIEEPAGLAGLPDAVVSGAADAARERGKPGRWVFTLHKPSLIPFLQYSERRDLRERMFMAYIKRGANGNELDNTARAARMAALRVERAGLLGYPTHADYVLEENMAKTPQAVYDFLDKLWEPALARARAEASEMQAMIQAEGGTFELQPWDWWYYAEKVKKAKFDIDEESLRPYFQLENVRDGAFMVAQKLYGITFEERTDVPKYHEDVRVFEVKDADGSHLAVLYVDYFPRASKQGGAWMNNIREQSVRDGRDIRPVIANNGNFSKPTADQPALISFEEALTLFHEFGHALHGILTRCTYQSLSGTNVPRDFVELPSQIMENWARHREVLKMYARHYRTGEPIPDELLDKMDRARIFNQGFETVEYLAACFLDMDWHTLRNTEVRDTLAFDALTMARIGLIPQIVSRYLSPYFAHIFSGGYSAGYYSYVWAEVLDSDAFEAFREAGLFDPATAESFRRNILEPGGTEDPMALYKRFRGREPRIEPLLKKRGLG